MGCLEMLDGCVCVSRGILMLASSYTSEYCRTDTLLIWFQGGSKALDDNSLTSTNSISSAGTASVVYTDTEAVADITSACSLQVG